MAEQVCEKFSGPENGCFSAFCVVTTSRPGDSPNRDRFIAFIHGNVGHSEAESAKDTLSEAALRRFRAKKP
jgi:hypothetical protein